MKTFPFRTRVVNDDTLKTEAIVEPHKLCIVEPKDLKHDLRVILVGLFLFLIPCGFWIHSARENHKLKDQLTEYAMITGMNMEYLNVEYLAGKYCTFKGKVPTDPDTLFKFVCESGAWYPEITMAQLIIESASFTSNVGKNARNGFGMKKCGEGPNSRPSLQIPGVDYSGYGVYMNWYHSVLDRHLWDLWVFKGAMPNSIEDYLHKIGNIYAEDPNYISKVKKIAAEWKEKADAYREAQQDVNRDSIGRLI